MPAQLLGAGPAQMTASYGDMGVSASGPVANRLLTLNRHLTQRGLDTTFADAMRPFVGPDGGCYINAYGEDGRPIVYAVNANGTLLPDQWKFYDDMIIRTGQPRLRAWGMLRSRVPKMVPGGLGVTLLEYMRVGNITPATMSMSPRRRSELDKQEYEPAYLPIPIIHKDFSIDTRQLMSSNLRSRGGVTQPLDTSKARSCSNNSRSAPSRSATPAARSTAWATTRTGTR
jgi:hypothetical protein